MLATGRVRAPPSAGVNVSHRQGACTTQGRGQCVPQAGCVHHPGQGSTCPTGRVRAGVNVSHPQKKKMPAPACLPACLRACLPAPACPCLCATHLSGRSTCMSRLVSKHQQRATLRSVYPPPPTTSMGTLYLRGGGGASGTGLGDSCTRTHTRTHTQAYTHRRTHRHTHRHTQQARVRAHTHTHNTQAHTHTCTHTGIHNRHARTHTHTHSCTHIYTQHTRAYTHTCTHTHTHTHTTHRHTWTGTLGSCCAPPC